MTSTGKLMHAKLREAYQDWIWDAGAADMRAR